jgi:AcrR family transcriptional regulator
MKTKNKKLKIIKAVEKLAKTHSFDEIKLDDVARIAGVGKGTIYIYFKDKDDLFAKTTLNGSEELCKLIEQYAESDKCFIEKLYTVCEAVSDFFMHRQALLRLMHEYEIRRGTNTLHAKNGDKDDIFSSVLKIMRQGIEENKLSATVPLETQAVFLLGLLRTRDWSFKRHKMKTPPVKLAVDIFLNGMRT